ncbi:protein mono-ADP-ribosyltransferase PARP14-like [Labeo rohita]|uniref:protein mono-ADP-ribosyltransferase PARP14-like n=1 Tax=Labeo rohita TaxID=84645 RepID=UPI0021E2D44D|nr:protein mono-ADP-ribosyltransferase PARP14-like [Labeo rohita]
MTSTLIGSSLLNKAGQQLQNNFNNAKGHHTLKPGEVLVVDATPALGCSKVFFIECAPKGNKHISEKALSSGLCRVFQLCEQNSFGSVALPVIGPSIVLSIPVKDAVNILTHEICKFLSGPTGHLHTICISIMPNYPNSEEMFRTVCGNLSAEMVDNTGQALFHSLTSDLDEIIMAVDGIEVHLVFGDITNETTDAIVNTTDFKDFQTAGVCKDILTKAGLQIQAQLTGAQVARGKIFTTLPGGFPCKTIMHVCGLRDPAVIKTLAKEIVVQCEWGRYRSVAIPAICAGKGGLDPSVVARSILEGVKQGIQRANLQHLKNIRIILLKINVFLEFKRVALQIFGVGTLLTATSFGHGAYFAVKASYSANSTYVVPAEDGTQVMFVARVFTGYHTQGQADMRTPPVRVAPDDLYDSVVDNTLNPSMFVVFHDCQAYPDYLITFK